MQSLVGVRVGSRTMAERLAGFASPQHLNPVIDLTFAFAKAAEAYEHLASGRHVGKVVITPD